MTSFLVVRLSSLGDVLFALAVAERLRQSEPDATIAFLTEDRFEAIPRAHPAIDETIVSPRREGVAATYRSLRRLRERRFDVAIDLQGNAKSALHLVAVNAPRKIGFARGAGRDASFLAVNERVTPPPEAVHRVDRFLSLVEPLGMPTRRVPPTPLRIPVWAKERAEAVVECDPSLPLAILHPGTSEFGAFKRWGAARFGALAHQLTETYGVKVLVTGGPSEAELVAEVVDRSQDTAFPVPALPSLLDLAALLERAGVVVAGDTGPLHLANRMGTPVVALYGPKDPKVYGPAFDPATVVRRDDVPCSPCTRRWCDAPACMSAIGTDAVLGAALRYLASRWRDRPTGRAESHAVR